MTLKVDTITDVAGTGAPNATDGITVGGTALSSVNQMEYTSSATEPNNPANGAVWWNTGDEKIYYYVNDGWYEIDSTPPPIYYGDTGVFAGGGSVDGANYYNIIQSVTISTTGNATDFGNLVSARKELAGCSNGSRGIYGAGRGSSITFAIDYITFATSGNGTNFGNLSFSRYNLSSCSDGLRGVFAGGFQFSVTNVIDYVLIATTGSANDFGDLDITTAGGNQTTACADKTRGLIAGGLNSSSVSQNAIQYITIQTTGNTTDFGDLLAAAANMGSCSDDTRGVFAGGTTSAAQNVIQYVTIQTTGNATDFGDLTAVRDKATGISNGTRGILGGGSQAATALTIDYFTIQTPGNASDFGDLSAGQPLNYMGGASGD